MMKITNLRLANNMADTMRKVNRDEINSQVWNKYKIVLGKQSISGSFV